MHCLVRSAGQHGLACNAVRIRVWRAFRRSCWPPVWNPANISCISYLVVLLEVRDLAVMLLQKHIDDLKVIQQQRSSQACGKPHLACALAFQCLLTDHAEMLGSGWGVPATVLHTASRLIIKKGSKRTALGRIFVSWPVQASLRRPVAVKGVVWMPKRRSSMDVLVDILAGGASDTGEGVSYK